MKAGIGATGELCDSMIGGWVFCGGFWAMVRKMDGNGGICFSFGAVWGRMAAHFARFARVMADLGPVGDAWLCGFVMVKWQKLP